ncbi:MAG: sulfotransferase [Chloroflexi bacterium]|nr:sulfotransferase [Chloroflexota bacterium]MCI0578299.1 sulfotransferase [Chloroflexota bacterium]MCI0648752.1 sulfotransferase [Chloroflexota bacterium]MCI0732115.1 sulfotransferase [Chloroflexota bacterium]
MALKLPLLRFDEAAVCRAAGRRTGLSDFGDPYYRQGLLRVLESAERDANLHFTGRLGIYMLIVSQLVNRLRLVEARHKTPELFDRPLIPPIIIMGLPRSGTTLLHRLLAADPAHRAVPAWEISQPFPGGAPDRRRQNTERQMKINHRLARDLDHKHYIRADTPEECIALLGATFISLLFWVFAPVYGYLEWYNAQDRRPAYREYRQLLQVLQAADPARRLTLKSPAHTGALAALRQILPDALIIQTHRDPIPLISSLNSLFYSFHGVVTRELDVRRMAEANVRLLENEAALNLAARQANPGAVCDVYYDHLLADPIGVVHTIYDHFSLAWTEEYEQQLRAYLAENPQGKHGRHRYSAADFGLNDQDIARRFSAYRENFGLANRA